MKKYTIGPWKIGPATYPAGWWSAFHEDYDGAPTDSADGPPGDNRAWTQPTEAQALASIVEWQDEEIDRLEKEKRGTGSA